MEIKKITYNKKQYLDLLLLGDEQESMIDRYLEHSNMFALFDNGLKTICVVGTVTDCICEIKNIATYENFQGQGYGSYMIKYILNHYRNQYKTMLVGTGDSPLTISFYEKCGFKRSHIIENFFIDNYDHPIFECGIQIKDMIYLKINLNN